MLTISGLRAGYGSLQIIHGLDLKVEAGEIVAVIGPNGSGKSTLLKAIFGLAKIYAGEIRFHGKVINSLPPHSRARLGIAYIPQLNNVFQDLTVLENLKMAGYLLKKHEVKERIKDALKFFPELKPLIRRRVGSLSGGERQMVALSTILIKRPKLILLDEPTTALSPMLVRRILAKITELKEVLNAGILLVEQNTVKALKISDKACLLVSGRCNYWGGAEDLLNNREFGKLYLGLVQ
ncbi:MAG: ABC transporter ATP-binding protein [Thermoprotei archaeon]|nr:MAG: ABC transporter ATP-binding protein [Thermoprotei archaeon]